MRWILFLSSLTNEKKQGEREVEYLPQFTQLGEHVAV